MQAKTRDLVPRAGTQDIRRQVPPPAFKRSEKIVEWKWGRNVEAAPAKVGPARGKGRSVSAVPPLLSYTYTQTPDASRGERVGRTEEDGEGSGSGSGSGSTSEITAVGRTSTLANRPIDRPTSYRTLPELVIKIREPPMSTARCK